MERAIRKPFQGLTNIVRFNWHFYIIAISLIAILFFIQPLVVSSIGYFILILILLAVTSILTSLVVSFYIYDRSDLYNLSWMHSLNILPSAQLVNINAGFDETSILLSQKLSLTNIKVFDFYDPSKHTEVSIERAREAYPAFNGTKTISTLEVPLIPCSTDFIFLILAAHEIRNTSERIIFFKQLKDSLSENGKIIVVEHLRDWKNFLAYNVGFFHFFSKKEWKLTFTAAGLAMCGEKKITPFISAFILEKNGTTS
jgi:hypothetical protein